MTEPSGIFSRGGMHAFVYRPRSMSVLFILNTGVNVYVDRTPGPVTGGAEVTGSFGMLPPAQREPKKPAVAGTTISDAALSDATAAAAAAASRASRTAPSPLPLNSATFVELRKPLALAWNVSLATSGEERHRTETHGHDGRVEEYEDEPQSEEGDSSVGKNKAKRLTEAEGGVSGDGDDGGDMLAQDCACAASRSGTARKCFRFRDPVWARLAFADRKR